MVTQHLLSDIFALSLDDRLELFERLRENLEHESSNPETTLTPETRLLLGQRLADFERDEQAGSSWDDVAARIHERLNRK